MKNKLLLLSTLALSVGVSMVTVPAAVAVDTDRILTHPAKVKLTHPL